MVMLLHDPGNLKLHTVIPRVVGLESSGKRDVPPKGRKHCSCGGFDQFQEQLSDTEKTVQRFVNVDNSLAGGLRFYADLKVCFNSASTHMHRHKTT